MDNEDKGFIEYCKEKYKDIYFEENENKIAPKYRAYLKIDGITCSVYSRNIQVFDLLQKLANINNEKSN